MGNRSNIKLHLTYYIVGEMSIPIFLFNRVWYNKRKLGIQAYIIIFSTCFSTYFLMLTHLESLPQTCLQIPMISIEVRIKEMSLGQTPRPELPLGVRWEKNIISGRCLGCFGLFWIALDLDPLIFDSNFGARSFGAQYFGTPKISGISLHFYIFWHCLILNPWCSAVDPFGSAWHKESHNGRPEPPRYGQRYSFEQMAAAQQDATFADSG